MLVVCLLARGISNLALFDFHEVAFAAPTLIVFCIAIRHQRAPLAYLSAFVLSLVKEDLGFTICAGGIAWLILSRSDRREKRPGWFLIAAGLAALTVANVVIKMVNDGSEYSQYFTGHNLVSWSSFGRLVPVILFILTALVVGLRSPIALVALPTLAWRFIGSRPNYWSIYFHYDLVPWAIAVVAAVDGLARARACAYWRRWATAAVAAAIASLSLSVWSIGRSGDTLLTVFSPGASVQQIRQAESAIPAGSKVAAINSIGPYLVANYEVYQLDTNLRFNVDYVFYADSGPWIKDFPACARQSLETTATQHGWQQLQVGHYRVVHIEDSHAIPQAFQACN